MTTTERDRRIAGVLAGAGCYQQADGSWVAHAGPMATLTGHGETREAALAALRRKVARRIRRS